MFTCSVDIRTSDVFTLSTVSITAGDEARFLWLHQFCCNIFVQFALCYSLLLEEWLWLSKLNALTLMDVCVCASVLVFFPRCHWEVLLWLLFSFQGVSFRFREWSSPHSLQWFSPRRCKRLKSVPLIPFKLTPISHLPHNRRRLPWTWARRGSDTSDLCFVKAPGTDSEDSQDSSDSGVSAQKTREILARRPSYR